MSFLQPFLLAALPLMALPVIIHLINQQRHRTIEWAAMMFLLDAKRMTRGMARLRHLLIMAMRVLAVAGLIFAVCRPLASGWVGLAIGGAPDTTIILLDRSPSMEQQNLQTGESKRSTGLAKLSELLETLGDSSRVILIENARNLPLEIDSAKSLTELPTASSTATPSDLPAMMQTALDYITANQTGRTDVWICSDLRENDWDQDSGRWASLRESFAQLEGVRFQLLAYTDQPEDNLAVEVRNVRRRQVGDSAEIVLDILLRRQVRNPQPVTIPLTFVINGARSVLPVEMNDLEYVLQGHSIPVDSENETGWGSIELPNDSNPQDNAWYFAFSTPAERHTVIVSDDPTAADLLRKATTAASEPGVVFQGDIVATSRVEQIDWSTTSFVIWHAPLPDGVIAQRVQSFVNNGRSILFLPPAQPSGNELFGITWGDWKEAPADEPFMATKWRGDSDLLGKTLSSAALPVGESRVYQICEFHGEGNKLAQFENGTPLLTRASTDAGAVYFCSTLPQASHSSLARDGIVFYVMLHRALQSGAASMGKARQMTAGSGEVPDLARASPLTKNAEAVLSPERAFHAGVYRQDDRLFALNRPVEEDTSLQINPESLAELFGGLDHYVVEDQLDSGVSLAREIWKTFLIAMVVALLVEAFLCLPPRPQPESEALV